MVQCHARIEDGRIISNRKALPSRAKRHSADSRIRTENQQQCPRSQVSRCCTRFGDFISPTSIHTSSPCMTRRNKLVLGQGTDVPSLLQLRAYTIGMMRLDKLLENPKINVNWQRSNSGVSMFGWPLVNPAEVLCTVST